MYKTNIFSLIIHQIFAIGVGIRIASGMLMASFRSGYTALAFVLMNTVFLLYYFDEISRTLFGGGSFIAWAIINVFKGVFKNSGFSVNASRPSLQWLLHIPEHFIVFTLLALLSLIMVHIVKNSLEGQSCGVGRGFFRAMVAWRFIVVYAAFMSAMVWVIGDVHHQAIRVILVKMYEDPFFLRYLYDPVYGKKVLETLTAVHYWLPSSIRFFVAGMWYIGSFLLFPVIVNEQRSFWQGVWRSFGLAFQNIGMVLSGALFYLMMYSGVMAMTLYAEAASFPSVEGMGLKSAQVIALFGLMTIILFTVHSALVTSGSLIAATLMYRICIGKRIPSYHIFSVDRPYLSCVIYLMFYIFYLIIIRCGIHVQMPTI